MTWKGGKMSKRFLSSRYCFLFVLFAPVLCMSGCDTFSATNPSAACTAETVAANIYKAEPLREPNIIFEFAHPPTPIPQPTNTADPVNTPPPAPEVTPPSPPSAGQIQGARYAAFRHLVKETERWSDIQKIKFSDSTEAEIVITFISPELLQAVSLGDALNERNTVFDFNSQARIALDSIAAREELLFLLTVTSPLNYTNLNNHIIKFDTMALKLKNAEGLELPPGHIESNLGEPINTSSTAVFGYFGYPVIKLVDGKCKWALDPKYNTNIVITLPEIFVDGVSTGPYSWTIAYMPLIDLNVPPPLPDFNIPPNYDQSQISPLTIPPSGIRLANRWQDFARFVWYKITLGN